MASSRIIITKLLPVLNRLVNAGVVPSQALQQYVTEAMKRPQLTVRDVISDLYGFKVPEGKEASFRGVVVLLNKIKLEEEENGFNGH